ncbi:hypothetical protein B566_EDAN018475 [Ephemera danica]|nr:hypothetical protein B566_EDAN018475 [Ephemera danica]
MQGAVAEECEAWIESQRCPSARTHLPSTWLPPTRLADYHLIKLAQNFWK